MKVFFIFLFFFIGCASHQDRSVHLAEKITAKMTKAEKYKILRSYRFLQTLSAISPGRMPIAEGYLPGIPRLGIPSVEFLGSDRTGRDVAREEKTLKIGFVNLIRDSEKTQVFGNFNEASEVDAILGPKRIHDLRSAALRGELKDLDLFLVQEGSKERARHYICAQYRDKDDFHCVAVRLETILKEMGIFQEYDELLAWEKIPPAELDRLVIEVLSTLDELKLL